MKAEVERQLDAKQADRQNRLAALAVREQKELPPLEAECTKVRNQIANLDKNLATLRAQQQAMPQSFGVPTGTKFQPAIPREVSDIGMQARQRWEALQREFAVARAEFTRNLRQAEDRVREKRQQFQEERQKVLSDF